MREVSPVASRRGAEEFERQVRDELLAPTARKAEVPTFAAFVKDRWWPTYPSAAQNRHATVKEKRRHLDFHLLPFFGPLRLDQIKLERFERFIALVLTAA